MARNKYPEETVELIVNTALKLFTEKGYYNTSIQDIINNLNGLSKGAIYHHFKSKEKIFDAVCDKLSEDNERYFNSIRNDKSKTGIEKLHILVQSAYLNPRTDTIMAIMQNFEIDHKFLANQIFSIYQNTVPQYVMPIVEEGIKDKTINTDYPKELSEVLVTLINIWLNPIISKPTIDEMEKKLYFFKHLLNKLNLNILNDEDIKRYIDVCNKYNKKTTF